MAKNRPSFGDAASKGLREAYRKNNSSFPETSNAEARKSIKEATTEEPSIEETRSNMQGINPYYEYHPKTGQKGGTLGRPRTDTRRTQISIGCTEYEKELYKKAAVADKRKLPDFINRAIMEYIENHGLNNLF